MRSRSLIWCLFLVVPSCVTIDSKEDFQTYKPSLERTASFDLGCAKAELTYSPLGVESEGYDKVGVSGCGKQAVYVLRAGQDWIKNSETTNVATGH